MGSLSLSLSLLSANVKGIKFEKRKFHFNCTNLCKQTKGKSAGKSYGFLSILLFLLLWKMFRRVVVLVQDDFFLLLANNEIIYWSNMNEQQWIVVALMNQLCISRLGNWKCVSISSMPAKSREVKKNSQLSTANTPFWHKLNALSTRRWVY